MPWASWAAAQDTVPEPGHLDPPSQPSSPTSPQESAALLPCRPQVVTWGAFGRSYLCRTPLFSSLLQGPLPT